MSRTDMIGIVTRMNASTHLQLVGATLHAGQTVMEKSASATPAARDVLEAAWPQEGEQLTKLASLSRMLATGLVVTEAAESVEADAA